MINIHSLTFNAFQENTYILEDQKTGTCIIFDPGCSNSQEEKILEDYIIERNLEPFRLINTHCHIDHILGNKFVSQKFNLSLEAHKNEVSLLQSGKMVSEMYGISYTQSPPISHFIEEGDQIVLGQMSLDILLTPGHSPGSLCFVEHESRVIIGGDVLFYGSIGRTDLPGGDYSTLINSIKTKLLVLPDDYAVYPGHGPKTSIGFERMNNPFLSG